MSLRRAQIKFKMRGLAAERSQARRARRALSGSIPIIVAAILARARKIAPRPTARPAIRGEM